jgi:hypothetical protein
MKINLFVREKNSDRCCFTLEKGVVRNHIYANLSVLIGFLQLHNLLRKTR